MDNNFDNMRNAWHKLTSGFDYRKSKDIVQNIISGNHRKTSLQHLALRYRRFSNLSFLFVFYFIMLMWNNELYTNTAWGIIAGIYACVFLLCCSIFDRWIYKGLMSISVTEMPVIEVINRVWFYRKRHLQFVACVMPTILCWVGILAKASTFDDNEYMIYGILTGAILGFVFGLRTLRSFMREYKGIRESLLE